MSDDQLTTDNEQLPEGYKQTEIGVIPEDWEPNALGEIFQLGNGFSFKSEFFSSDGPIVLTPGNFKLEGGLYFNDKNTKRYSGSFPESTSFQKGDLLVVMTDLTPECNLLGKPAFVDSEEIILHNQRIGKIHLLSENIDKQFLYFLLLSNSYLKRIKEQATGSTVRHTSNKSIYSVVLPIPQELEEQRSLAQALSDVDRLIAALEKAIAKKRAIKTDTMQQLLTGKKRLPGFGEGKDDRQTEVGLIPEDWVPTPLEKISAFITKGSTPTTYGFSWVQDGILFLRSECVSESGLDLSQSMFISRRAHAVLNRSELRSGDILITITGNVGRVVYLGNDFGVGNMNQHIARVRIISDSAFSGFVYHFLTQSSVRRAFNVITTGQAYPQISLKQVRDAVIPLPSLLEQRAIATVLSDMDGAIAALETRLAKTQALKQGMMQALLTGRVRLKIEI